MSKVDEVLTVIEGMTVLELSELLPAFEEKFGVTAAAPMAAMPMMAAEAAVEEEKDSYDVILSGAGEKKIAVIKEVRALTGLGLKDAKDLVEGAPKAVLEGANKIDAEKAKDAIEAAGGIVELK